MIYRQLQVREFGKLVKAAIGSIAALEGQRESWVEEYIGEQVGKTASTIRKYKGEGVPPDWETVRFLAEIGVRKGWMGQRWLERFLKVSEHPDAKEILDSLFPADPKIVQTNPHPKSNLSASPFVDYVSRTTMEKAVVEALGRRSALVMLVGSAGVGKTSLIFHIATESIESPFYNRVYQAIVWIDVVGRQGGLTLDGVWDTIARTLEDFSLAGETTEVKRGQIDRMLRSQRVLLILDSIDTLIDQMSEPRVADLLAWLQSIPEPSKALVTCTQYFREDKADLYWNSTSIVRLREMDESETREFIQKLCYPDDINSVFPEERLLIQFQKAVAGNPKAIKLALGYIRYGGRKAEDVIDELLDGTSRIFDLLFTKTWETQVGDHGRTLWMSMVPFHRSADPDALLHVSDLERWDFDRALEDLVRRSVLSRVRHSVNEQSRDRIVIHALDRAYARTHWERRTIFHEKSQDRWLQWYLELVEPIGSCWGDIRRLERLDWEGDHAVSVMRWALEHGRFEEVYKLARGTRYFYYVRGQLDRRLLVDKLHLEAARQAANRKEELRALAYHILIAGRQSGENLVDQYYAELEQCVSTFQVLPDNLAALYWQASAMYQMNRENYAESIALWEKTLEYHDPRMVVGARHWIARCYFMLSQLA